MPVVHLVDAEQLVLARLREYEQSAGMPLAIRQGDTREYKDGWLFFYNTEDFHKTGNLSSRLVGNGPLFVKRTGEIIELATHQPVEDSLHQLGVE
jgi:hypothetical protein